jgi:hypothetical protein
MIFQPAGLSRPPDLKPRSVGWVVNVCVVGDRGNDMGAGLPANRRQTDQLALAMFEVLRHRSEPDRRHVLDE